MHLENLIKLLKYKPQIILQGPPGTGKTRLAKQIAEEMCKAQNLGSPLKKIEFFLKSYDATIPEIAKKRGAISKLLQEFYQDYPKDMLHELTLDNYPLGTDDEHSFCWWLEYGLWDLGGYSGVAGKFKLYWKKDTEEFKKSGFLKAIDSDETAMKLLAEQISNVANEKNLSDA
jgi:5-methylcytosine-specific restriction protein B